MSIRLRIPRVSPRAFTCGLLAAVLAGCAVSRRSSEPLVPATAPATAGEVRGLAEFHEGMARYVTLRDRVVGATPVGTATTSMPDTSHGSLAAEIRRQRSDAKQGEVFRPDVQALFRRAVAEELKDPLAFDTRHTLGQGNPGTASGVEQDRDIAPRRIVLVVNDPYPAGGSRSTMPARLLQRLPPLPPSIDYRFVGSALVLVDTRASLVIDYLPDAVPADRRPKG
jgi:hypothetical protein